MNTLSPVRNYNTVSISRGSHSNSNMCHNYNP